MGAQRPARHEEEPWTLGMVALVVGIVATVLGALACWLSPPLRLAGIVAITVGVGLFVGGLGLVIAEVTHGPRPGLGSHVLVASAAVAAAAIVFFFAAGSIGPSVAYARRYGIQVYADVGRTLDCEIVLVDWTRNRKSSCAASWQVDGEPRRGRLVDTDDAAKDTSHPTPAHVHDADSLAAYRDPPAGTRLPDDSSLVLGHLTIWPLLPAVVVEAVAMVVLLFRRPRRLPRAAGSARRR